MGVKLRQRPPGSGVWWIFIDYRGKRRARKLGTNEKDARETAAKIEAQLKAAYGAQAASPNFDASAPL